MEGSRREVGKEVQRGDSIEEGATRSLDHVDYPARWVGRPAGDGWIREQVIEQVGEHVEDG